MDVRWFATSLLLAFGCAVAAATVTTGIRGSVTTSPSHPGPQRIGDSSKAPMAGAKLLVRDANQQVVARITADANGQFAASLAAGEYSVEVDVGGAALPRCGAGEATVREGQVAEIEIECDSGMR